MNKYFIQDSTLRNIANAIRSKTLETGEIKVTNMAASIEQIESGDLTDYSLLRNLVEGSAVTNIYHPSATSIRYGAFVNDTNLSIAHFPAVINIAGNAFFNCSNLKEINCHKLTHIGGMSFYECVNLTTIDCPNVINIDSLAFCNCKSLTTVNFPNLNLISASSFFGCNNLVTANLSNATAMGNAIFSGCSNLTTVDLSTIQAVAYSAFYNCVNLTAVNLSSSLYIYNNAFTNCTSLMTINLPGIFSIYDNAFLNCASLKSVILPNTRYICSLIGNNHFSGTPIASGVGNIYVPGTLLYNYKNASGWNAYTNQVYPFDSAIIGLKNYYVTYQDVKSYSLKYAYPNCTILPTVAVASSNESIVTVSDLTVDQENITFNANALSEDGSAEIIVTATFDDVVVDDSAIISVFKEMPQPTYCIEPVDNVDYSFELNDNGYYESMNKDVNNSSAMCKIIFNCSDTYNVYIDYIYPGRYNVGYFLDIDATLPLITKTPIDNIFLKLEASSSSTNTIDYGTVESGEHFIYVKYVDTDYYSSTSSLQFKIRFESVSN